MSRNAAPRRARTGTARERAADVLVRVESDDAFASPALGAALDREPSLSAADRALATELVYGVLRSAPALDARLAAHATRAGSLDRLDPFARACMRIAAYEILALDRVPPRASVHAAVETLKRDRSSGLAGFANAVLRRIAGERPQTLAPDARARLALASIPSDVRATIATALGGDDEADAVLRAMCDATPSEHLRANMTRIARDDLAARLGAEVPSARIEPGALVPWCLHVRGGGDLSRAPSYREGLFALQEEGAQAVALATGAKPGQRVLDACAGHGGKTGALAAMMNATGVLHAAELYPEKAARIGGELARLGLASPTLEFTTAAVDLARGLGALAPARPASGYDIVLVDAPCSGLGTLARRPEIVRRRDVRVHADDAAESPPEAPSRTAREPLPSLQRAILARVAPLVAPGGTLLYAVCTLARDEGDDVIDRFRAEHPSFVPSEGDASLPPQLRPARVILRPDRDGTDGFMLYRLRRA